MSRYLTVQRTADVVLGAVGLLVVAPVLAVAAAAVKFESRGPVLFAQARMGRDEQIFTLYKFRSMVVGHGTTVQTYDASPGVTRVGRVLRRTKVDVLPQLWNVLTGDMSLVGPRPPLPALIEEMPIWAKRRFSVRPGLTGLAQVNGNVCLSWEERWQYDVLYADTISLFVDLEVLARTAWVVLLGDNHSAQVLS